MTFFSTSARRCLAAAVLLFVGMLPTLASNPYYYKASVKVSSECTGGGLVYINSQATAQNNREYAETGYVEGGARGDDNASANLYLYAQPTTTGGAIWEFSHWEQSENGNDYTKIDDATSESYIPNITFNGSRNSRTPFYYQAVFKQQTGVVKVAVAETGRGSASITSDPKENVVNGNATLTAYPDASNGIHFLGWNKAKDNTQNLITDNPYEINPITYDKIGTYYAHFSEAPENIYCRIQNRNTGRFLMLYGNNNPTNHRTQNRNDGFIFNGSLKLINQSEANGNPMTVFLRTGHPDQDNVSITNNANLVANDIQYTNLINQGQNTMSFIRTENGVQIFTSYKSGNNEPFNTYLTDEGGDWAVTQADYTKNIYWDVYLLEEELFEEGNTAGSFGANAKEQYTQNNMYYTTMYTYFPYKLLDGVKAYYLPLSEEAYTEETNTAHFIEYDYKGADNAIIVPMKTAVVLECTAPYNGTDIVLGTNNKLLPLLESQNPLLPENLSTALQNNLLNGYISMNGGTVDNNKSSMFILSTYNGKLGWYYSPNNNMTPNKAYLDLSEFEHLLEEHANKARSIRFTFGLHEEESGEATGIIAHKIADEVDGPLFDLNGRRVTNGDAYGLKKGIYINNGKKIIVK